MTKYTIQRSEIAGKGLIASANISKNQRILTVKGSIKKESYAPGYLHLGPRWLALGKEIWISPSRESAWRFINHSCSPNAGLKGRVTVVAMKNIRHGEEITIDYSITEDDPFWSMKCSCREKNCRKILRSVRFLSKERFNKYKEYIPKSLRRLHLKHKEY